MRALDGPQPPDRFGSLDVCRILIRGVPVLHAVQLQIRRLRKHSEGSDRGAVRPGPHAAGGATERRARACGAAILRGCGRRYIAAMDSRPATVESPEAPGLADAARSLSKAARGRALGTDRNRRLPVETITDLKTSGLARILQPARCGGLELDYRTHLDAVEEVSRGCGSTGWCLGVFHVNSWLVGLFPEEAQDEIYGAEPGTLVAAVLDPLGTARRRGDGYVLEGFWPFASGSEHADWAILGARVPDPEGGAGGEACFAVPIADIAVHDDWHVAGLRGTGSCSLGGEEISVPAHRVLPFGEASLGRAPGRGLHRSNLYRAPLVPCLALALCAPAIGLAAGSIPDFADHVSGRTDRHRRGAAEIESPLTHQTAAAAAAGVDMARALLRRAADDIHEAAGHSGRMTRKARARVRMDCAFAVRLCQDAIDEMFLACGGAGLSERNPIQRAWRDVHAIGQHALLRFGPGTEIYGRTLLGLDPGTDIL